MATTLLGAWELESTSTGSPGTRPMPSGNNRLLLYIPALSVTGAANQTVTSVSYGNRSMTLIRSSVTAAAGQDINNSSWYLKDADILLAENTNFTITRSSGETATYRAVTAIYDGVDQTNPILDSFIAQGLAGVAPVPVAINTELNAHVIGAHMGAAQSGGTQDVAWNNMSERIESTNTLVYLSVADTAGTGSPFTSSITPANHLHTVLQAFSLKSAPTGEARTIAGSCISGTDGAGALAVARPLAGNAVTATGAAGAIAVNRPVAGSSITETSASGNIEVTTLSAFPPDVELAGSAGAAFTLEGSDDTLIERRGSVGASFTMQGDL